MAGSGGGARRSGRSVRCACKPPGCNEQCVVYAGPQPWAVSMSLTMVASLRDAVAIIRDSCPITRYYIEGQNCTIEGQNCTAVVTHCSLFSAHCFPPLRRNPMKITDIKAVSIDQGPAER